MEGGEESADMTGKLFDINDIDELEVQEPDAKYDSGKDFASLDAWKNARVVKLFFYNKIIPKIPSHEKYNLDIQIRKAAVSCTANIAEGYGRFHFQEGIQFYRIARGSLYELKDRLITCFDLDYIDQDLLSEGKELLESAKRTLNGYINFVRNQVKSKV